ncbi:MAG: insulinase family protein [Planctomycetes bacterium]|nr:insulinase family protein [Planctomycetota bacterium]
MNALLIGMGFAAAMATADDPSDFTLANGLRVRLVPARADKEVVLILGLRAGMFDEPAGVPHLAHVTEHATVFDTTSAGDAAAVDRWFAAGRANAETLPDFMYFDLHVSPEDLVTALRVQAMRLSHRGTDAATLAREVPRTLSEIEMLENPAWPGGTAKFAFSAFVQAVLHGRSDSPIKAASRAITPQNVCEFQARAFRPDRAFLSLVGDFDPASARKVVESAFGSIAKPKSAPIPRPTPKPGRLDASWDASTSHVLVGWPVPASTHPDHAALTAASAVLMQRLFMDPEINSIAKMPMVTNEIDGLFVVNAQAKSARDVDALESKLLDRIARLATPDGIGDPEVRMACAQYQQLAGPVDVDKLPLPPNVSRSLARSNVELQRMMRAAQWGDVAAYVKRLGAIDAKAVRDAAARYLDPKTATVVKLRPSA